MFVVSRRRARRARRRRRVGVRAGSGFGGVTVGAVAAGAALVLAPHATSIFAAAGMLAPDGRCKTLDADADGYVRTEAVWAMPLWSTTAGGVRGAASPAAAAVIRASSTTMVSSAVNQDGRSASLTAPNGPSQQAVLTAAARGASPALDRPADALEMHGTGTALGDPIEFGAAVAVFAAAREGFARFERFSKGGGMRPSSDGNRGNRPSSDGKDASAANGTAANGTPSPSPSRANGTPNTPRTDAEHTPHHTVIPAFLSGIKSARGHAEAAAGAWGLIHAASQLTTRRGGATNHLREINPHVARVLRLRADTVPVAAPRRQDRGWASPHNHERVSSRLGIHVHGASSFAFQGTNAHALVAVDGSKPPRREMTKTVAAFDRSRAWCAPLAPPALTRVAGYDTFRRRVRIVADFASPTRLAIFGRETIPAGVLVSLAAAAAGFVADRRAAATRSGRRARSP